MDNEERKEKRRRKRAKEQQAVFGILGAGIFCLLAVVTVFAVKIWKNHTNSHEKKDVQAVSTEELIPQELSTEQEQQKEPELTAEEQKEAELSQQASGILESMTLEEKICQMFIVTPEALTGYGKVTAAGDATKTALQASPVGGLIYFEQNIVTPDQTKEMLGNIQNYAGEISGLPLFLCVDEEGGKVTRIGKNEAFGVETFEDMSTITDKESAYHVGDVIGAYLSEYGFNVDFAPDADVLTNSGNTVIGTRSFGSDPNQVAELAGEVSRGLKQHNVMSTFKHFPGHGATEADSHEGAASTDKTYEQLMQSELVPFEKAKEYGVDFIMTGHISLPAVIEDDKPASLSPKLVTDILRTDLGYDGLIVTDALNMGAITDAYSPGDASVLAIKAGNDLLLMPSDFKSALERVKNAVEAGELTEERINESVTRIIKAKLRWTESRQIEQKSEN